MSRPVDLKEFESAYLLEMEEQMSTANARLLAIEAAEKKGLHEPRAVRELFRAIHTVKGLSAMVGVEPVVAIAHRVEAILRSADHAGGTLAPAAVDVMLTAVRAIEAATRALSNREVVAAPSDALLTRLDALETPDPPRVAFGTELLLEGALADKLAAFETELLVDAPRAGKRALRMTFVPSHGLAASGVTINKVRERVEAIAEIVKVLPISVARTEGAPGGLAFVLLVITTASDAELAAACGIDPSGVTSLVADSPPARSNAGVAGASSPPVALDALAMLQEFSDARRETGRDNRWNVLRVEVGRVDEAMERLATLIVTRSRLFAAIERLTRAGVDTRELSLVVADHARQLRDLRAAILQVRMVPMMDILERVPLIVRGLRRTNGKSVRLELDAGSAELDKSVAERMFPALVHLVRNAVDHGIETPAARIAAGKPEEGCLRITCSARANTRLELRIEDDGAGIDAAAVAMRAGADVPRTNSELLELLCRPGFSTSEKVTTTSGRGMGMDIVKKVVDELGGDMQVETKVGHGTVMTLRVPLSIAIIDAFMLRCGKERFVVPVSMVEEILDMDQECPIDVPTFQGSAGKTGMIQRRGEVVPLLDLSSLLDLAPENAAGRRALVVRHGGQPVGIIVDRVLGQREAVVRPLVDPLIKVLGISGATDLGDGMPTLVLDLVALSSKRLRAAPRLVGGARALLAAAEKPS